MQKVKLYLKPHQELFLISLCGKPPKLSARFNLAPLVFSLLRWEEYISNEKSITVYLPDWVMESSGGMNHIGEYGHKIFGDYIDSLIDISMFNFLLPYHTNDRLNLKDGIHLFMDQNNLPNDMRTYEMLKKRDYRMRKKFPSKNPIKFFDNLSPISPKLSQTVFNSP